jgi:predicted nucleic acid binding AN1-type Zn finger protein
MDAVTKDFCDKCQECNRDQFTAIIDLMNEKFTSLKQTFIVGGTVIAFLIGVIEFFARVAV